MNFDEFKDYPDTTTPLNAKFLNGLLNLLMPIGKTEIFYDNDDHSNYMGFTWERTSIGKVPVGIDTSDTDFNTIGKTGGEKSHKLTIDEMPKHNHDLIHSILTAADNQTPITSYSGSTTTAHYYVASTNGGDQPHNNIQPYEVMAFWKRIS